MLREGRQYAENYLVDELYKRAQETGNSSWLGTHINLVEPEFNPLISCWLRNKFHEEVKTIYEDTECEALSKHLSLVASMRAFGER